MASSSSTKRAAKMAQRGKGRKVRFQNGTTFPALIAVILILGLGLIVYSRQSIAPPDATPPQPGAEWEVAYGFNICGTWYQFSQSASIEDTPAYERYLKYGFDSQGDGIAYLNVTEENAPNIAGKRAILQRFLDVYGADITDDTMTFSPDYLPLAVGQEAPSDTTTSDAATTDAATGDSTTAEASATDSGTAASSDASSTDAAGDGEGLAATEYSEADTECDGKRAEIAVRVWDTPTAAKSQRYIAKVGRIQISQPAMVIAIYFDDPEAEQTQPPSVATLNARIAAATPTVATTVPVDFIPADPTTGDGSVTSGGEQTSGDQSGTSGGDGSSDGPFVTEPFSTAPRPPSGSSTG